MNSPENFNSSEFLKTAPNKPGVYVMYDKHDKIIYIGKAKNLKKRLSSYFQKNQLSEKSITLVAQIARIELNITHTEVEALILEYNLINKHKPKYNILLKDGKNFIYISISDDPFPTIEYQHGIKNKKLKNFGPFPSGYAAKQSVMLLQKIFKIRDCSNSYFSNRSRPCLQYQIGKCTAPCVGYISKKDYGNDIDMCIALLNGKNEGVMKQLTRKMEKASQALDFELAAKYRDQVISLRTVNEKQYVSKSNGEVDIIAMEEEGATLCISVCYIRQGKNLGFRQYFPKNNQQGDEEVLNSFIGQYYLKHPAPREIVVAKKTEDSDLIVDMIAQKQQIKTRFVVPSRGEKASWLALTRENARTELQRKLATRAGYKKRLLALQELLELGEIPSNMECFDISHTFGESTVGSCVVFSLNGPEKSRYRRFNLKNIKAGDDYAAMQQVLTRRYTRLIKEKQKLPDIVFIDGGKGQLTQAREVLQDLNIYDQLAVVGVAKGPERIAGEETLILDNTKKTVESDRHNPGFHLIQQIRDEAHRFAISGHRGQRSKKRNESLLQSIPGLGPKRRKTLLTHFGGLQGVSKARVEDLAKVDGISKTLAESIYQLFHPDHHL